MSELKSAELVATQNLDFAVGDTSSDSIPFAVTGVLRRNKQDNTLFVSNIRSTKINGNDVRVGDSYRVTDDKTGEDILLRVKLSVSDSRKKWADAPKASKLEGEAITNV